MGVYCDVGLDVTTRTSFQKGFYITLVEDCTTSLHLRAEESLAWLSRYYGARVLTHDRLMGMSM